jgi:nicotinamidase-related amidase
MARSATDRRTTGANADEASVAVPVAGTALLLIDVINDLAFDGSDALVAQAESMAAPLARLKRRATAAGVPTIYINDNFGQWRSDFRRARDLAHPAGDSHGHRGQHLRALHRQRRVHARIQDLRAGRLHCLQHGRRQ